MEKYISQYLDLINETLDRINYPQTPDELYAPIRYELSLGGKRIRPILTLMACDLFAGDINQALKPAIGLEIFHNFTLLHDDVMDKSELRRGKPTVHHVWDENHAILSGDAMQIMATQQMTQVPPRLMPAILDVFLKTSLEICEGQQFDMEFETRSDVSTDEYIEMIRLKTAVLLGCALKVGAIIAGAPVAQADAIYRFGENLGLAFQLQDDYLDVYGDPIIFGKNLGGDILNDKKTFMLIEAQRLAQGSDLETLQHYIGNNDVEPREKIDAVRQVYDNIGIDIVCRNKMEEYYNAALTCIEEILVPEERKMPLIALAQSLMNRNH
ncbi:MAG: polyprenyl synthetase family protein [Bacteroidaceae bacterium]|nr:polyprenyl synthetase family protein [Bacteroidaceae bacterium]